MPDSALLQQFYEYVSQSHPRSLRGIHEARDIDPHRFDIVAEQYLMWVIDALGEDGIASATDAFAQFSTDVILAQAQYEADGAYASKSFAEVYADHYSNSATMDGYLWGIYLSNFLWVHHFEIMLFFQDRFLKTLDRRAQVVEIAPGHGGWGVWALAQMPGMSLEGYDISPQSIQIASSVATAAGVDDRATYVEKDGLELSELEAAAADGCICSFLVEHLEDPQHLFDVINHLLKSGGTAFITGALTAAQVDHIYEFRRESELVVMCEKAGLRVLDTLSSSPLRTLPNAQFLPRSMALLVQKRANDIY